MRETVRSKEVFRENAKRLPDTLKQFGFDKLRPGQFEPIMSILSGQDTICILPTGQGKTAVFAIPTVAGNHKTVVFSPLISLMRDQIQSMNEKGIRAATINSSVLAPLNMRTLNEWAAGEIDMLYLAPEQIGKPALENAMKATRPTFVVMDECHTLSMWSDDFRAAYKACGDFIATHNPDVVAALTATATDEVVEDTKNVLGIGNAALCRHYPPRTNLQLSSSSCSDDALYGNILSKVREVDGSVIVYVQRRADASNLKDYLGSLGESVVMYHAGMTAAGAKEISQDAFMSGSARICVATNAFGMGIDKPDIEAVIHMGAPQSVEAVAQEIGRAARDGRKAICHMFSTPSTDSMQEWLNSVSSPTKEDILTVFDVIRTSADGTGLSRLNLRRSPRLARMKSFDAAITVLLSSGCISREEPAVRSCIVTVLDKGRESEVPRVKSIVDIVEEEGFNQSPNPNEYHIDVAIIAERKHVQETTIRALLSTLRKEGYIDYEPPPNYKYTKILMHPDEKILDIMEKKCIMKRQKLVDVQRYHRTPDGKKHDFLSDYFALNR